ncbi:hypothetical protein [Flintibacter porci]|uniref:hypothetical protein n=1 Tax=Flintibacter porci TaxID=3342383 RepID=UPI003F8BD13F
MKIERSDDFGGAVLNCAVRYALGRFSYMPGLVMDEIRPMLKDCSDKTLWCFDRDISEWLAGRTGEMYAYEKEWACFRDEVRRIIQERKKEMRADKKNESGIEYSWSGIGKLKILFRGRRNAILRFDPDTGVQGRTEAAKSVEKETILQHQEE